MFESLVTMLTAFYSVSHPSFASVRFSGDADLGLFFSIIHASLMVKDGEARVYSDVYEFLGSDASAKIEVEDKDVIVVLAKRNDSIVASQVYEVDLSATDAGYLLIPRGGYNILCEQRDVTCDDQKLEKVPQYVTIL